MILNSFEIRSYRSCSKTILPLHPNLTVLVGVNAAGKSNILNGMLLLNKMYRYRYYPEIREHHNMCHIALEVKHHNKVFHMKGDIRYETDEKNFDEILLTKIKWNLKEFSNSSDWLDIPIELIQFKEAPHYIRKGLVFQSGYIIHPRERHHKISNIRDIIPKNIHSLLLSTLSFFKNINYYSASQFSDPSRCPVSFELEENRPLRRHRPLVDHGQFLINLYQAWKSNNKQYVRYINTVGKGGLGLIDGISFKEVKMPSYSLDVKSGGRVKKVERSRQLIVPCFTVSKIKLSPNQLSEGTFKTLAILFYILTSESKMLLIEEPEVCIHHGLLNSILELIKLQSRDKQIVISTHSDFVLDHVSPENVVLVRHSSGKGTDAQLLSKSMAKNDFKALKTYLEDTGNLGDYWKEGGFGND